MLKDLLKEVLNEKSWQYSQVENDSAIFFGISGDNGNFQCVADTLYNQFIFFSICGANAPVGKRTDILELINLLNYDLFFGNFEMNSEHGEVRFKTNVPCDFFQPTKEFVEQVIMSNIVLMDERLPCIMEILYGNSSPQDAVKLIKHQEETEG